MAKYLELWYFRPEDGIMEYHVKKEGVVMRYPERKLTTLAKEAFIELAQYEFDELTGIEYFEIGEY